MKNLFGWINEIDLIFAGVVIMIAIAIVILMVLLTRGGRSLDTKKVLDAIDGTRKQIGDVDKRIEQDHRFQKNWMLRILARFGFLDAQDTFNDIRRQKRKDEDTQ